jgi:dihydrolipoamide dehydrogenase
MLSFDPESQAILGVGIVGFGATELISEGVLALEMGATLYDLATVVRPHPTRSEMLSEAARTALSSI